MTKPPSRYDVAVRVAKEDGHQADPAAFAVIASQAALSRNASVLNAHTAEEIICLVSVAAPDRPSAVAVALAVVAYALKESHGTNQPVCVTEYIATTGSFRCGTNVSGHVRHVRRNRQMPGCASIP
jgi:hypothetical protein